MTEPYVLYTIGGRGGGCCRQDCLPHVCPRWSSGQSFGRVLRENHQSQRPEFLGPSAVVLHVPCRLSFALVCLCVRVTWNQIHRALAVARCIRLCSTPHFYADTCKRTVSTAGVWNNLNISKRATISVRMVHCMDGTSQYFENGQPYLCQ